MSTTIDLIRSDPRVCVKCQKIIDRTDAKNAKTSAPLSQDTDEIMSLIRLRQQAEA